MTDVRAGARRGPGPQRRPALTYWVFVAVVVVAGLVVLGHEHLAPSITLAAAAGVSMLIGIVQVVRAWRAHPVPPDLGFADTNRMGEAGLTPDRVVALPARLRGRHLAGIRRVAGAADAGVPWILPAWTLNIVLQVTLFVIADEMGQRVLHLFGGLFAIAFLVPFAVVWRRLRMLLDHPDVIAVDGRDGTDAEPTDESGSRRD